MVGRSSLRARRSTASSTSCTSSTTRITDELTPIVNKSYISAVSKAEDIGRIGDQTVKSLVDDGMQRMQNVVQIGSETNLVTGLLTASALTNSPAILAMLEDRFTASARRAEKQLDGCFRRPTNTIRCATRARSCSSSPISRRRPKPTADPCG